MGTDDKLDNLQLYFNQIEEALEKQSSHKHEPKVIELTKIKGTNNTVYEEGSVVAVGRCEGIEVGKCVYVYGGIGGRWFRTSIVQSVDEQNSTFDTMNSTYKYQYL